MEVLPTNLTVLPYSLLLRIGLWFTWPPRSAPILHHPNTGSYGYNTFLWDIVNCRNQQLLVNNVLNETQDQLDYS